MQFHLLSFTPNKKGMHLSLLNKFSVAMTAFNVLINLICVSTVSGYCRQVLLCKCKSTMTKVIEIITVIIMIININILPIPIWEY